MVLPGFLRRVAKAFPTIVQAVALIAVFHLVGQGLISRFGGAKYRFSRNQHIGYGVDKVQKVIKYVDKNIPKYHPKPGNQGKTKITTPPPASTTTTTPAPAPALSILEQEQRKRIQTLQDGCARINEKKNGDENELTEFEEFLRNENLPTKPLWQNLICSKEHHLSFCPSYKSAQNYIFKKMLLLSPKKRYTKEALKDVDIPFPVLARKDFGYLDSWDMYPEFTESGTTFLFVRNPFQRLLSAFRDKLEDPSIQKKKFNEYYYNKYGRRIVMHYRRAKITGPTFKYPRFNEFLEFIVNRDIRHDDEEWAPYFMGCSPCQIKYNFIGHFETLYWDIHLLANKTGLSKEWDDPQDFFQSSTSTEVEKEYYSLVDRDIIRKIYSRYRIDFDLFGYSPDEYISWSIPGPDDIVETSPKPQDIPEPADDTKDSNPDNKNSEIVSPEAIQVDPIPSSGLDLNTEEKADPLKVQVEIDQSQDNNSEDELSS
ncbi:carbohydrate sulfotransferase 13 [Eurytemora carolleeae]|uniref:carbohydrate sulfotransferase 13 n=1 Tax=Eurytemora carolleeae TaxID=1294199 RepID=UPI000C786015|nr:carbohydrate sulfotransferase 13 [Eurytemora carolleeae]|eukprot:XP_023320692.1 carbohydrate sulfotransferase 13-like [Eurytemora affinis]